jgi:hypothetical protein
VWWKALLAVVALLTLGRVALIPVGGDLSKEPAVPGDCAADPFGSSDIAPAAPVDLVFLHHSVGDQLLSDPPGTPGSTRLHENGGGLARLLSVANYRVHEATYGSRLGEHTDLFDWLPKFRGHMDDILAIDQQDTVLPEGTRNRIVVFKSCYPNSQFVGIGQVPGNPAGPELTEANARATMRAVRDELEKHPDVLFVYLTAPPVLPRTWSEPLWKRAVKFVLRRPTADDDLRRSGALARRFNAWVLDPQGWLRGYPHRNIVVFDFYDLLTGNGASNFLVYPGGPTGEDNHPAGAGNQNAAPRIVARINWAVARMQGDGTAR